MGDDKNTYLPTRRRPTPGSWRVKIERGLIVSRPVAILRNPAEERVREIPGARDGSNPLVGDTGSRTTIHTRTSVASVAILRAAVVGGIMLAAYVGVSAITNRPEVPATQPAAVPDFEVGQ